MSGKAKLYQTNKINEKSICKIIIRMFGNGINWYLYISKQGQDRKDIYGISDRKGGN